MDLGQCSASCGVGMHAVKAMHSIIRSLPWSKATAAWAAAAAHTTAQHRVGRTAAGTRSSSSALLLAVVH